VGRAKKDWAKILALCLVICLTSTKLIALGLSFLFCTIRVMIPALQGDCYKDERHQKVAHMEQVLDKWELFLLGELHLQSWISVL
jgi:hypothetical protein